MELASNDLKPKNIGIADDKEKAPKSKAEIEAIEKKLRKQNKKKKKPRRVQSRARSFKTKLKKKIEKRYYNSLTGETTWNRPETFQSKIADGWASDVWAGDKSSWISLVLVNTFCEMSYILKERLIAKKIRTQKSNKILGIWYQNFFVESNINIIFDGRILSASFPGKAGKHRNK